MEGMVGRKVGGRYQIVKLLGKGGMAAVYQALDERLGRHIALKVISTMLDHEMAGEFLARFEREARALAQLNHPNIVKVHDYGEDNGKPYLVMEYLSGGTLKKYLGERMHYSEAARLLIPVAKALSC